MGLEYRTPGLVTTPVAPEESDDDEATCDALNSSPGVLRTQRRNTLLSPPSHPESVSTESEEPCSSEKSSSNYTAIPEKRLEIIQNVFKHVRTLSIDSLCADILGPAMSVGDDELVLSLVQDTIGGHPASHSIRQQLLYLAIVHGRCNIVSLVLARGANINSPPMGQSPALHQAVSHHRHTRIVDLLLKANAEIDATDNMGRTALGLAVSLGKQGMVEHLIRSGADMNLSLQPALPPLYEALLLTKSTEIYRLLKARGALACAPDNCRLEQVIREEWIPFSRSLISHSGHGICKFQILRKACEDGKIDEVSSLLSDLSFLTPSEGRKILALALVNKYVDLAKVLISGNVGNVSETGYDGKSVLELSVEIGDTNLVSLIMAKTKSSLYPLALLMAVHLQNYTVAKLLLEAGTSQTDTLLQYPLTVAAQKGDNDMVSLLLRHGADANYQNQYGMRPLELAVDWGRDTTAEILIQGGAIPNANLLSTAVRNRLICLARHLLAHCSADPNQICPETGLSPLQEESSKRDPNYDLVALLLRFGGDIYQTSPWRTSSPPPLLRAIRERNTFLVKCLLDNHKCSRLRCRRELPAVLREADPLLLSDVRDNISAHESRLWQQDDIDDIVDMNSTLDIDGHANPQTTTNLHNSTDSAQALHNQTTATYAQHFDTTTHLDHQIDHPLDHSALSHTLESTAAHAAHQKHPSTPQVSSHTAVSGGTAGGHAATSASQNGGNYSEFGDQDHHNIDFRTMTTIYPYWNPILLGVVPTHNQH